MQTRRDVFQAIADPTRREIIDLLAVRPLNLNSIADNFGISRPAISKHIRILTECGLIDIRQEGRERFCSARLQGLKQVNNWTAKFETFWAGKLNALELMLREEKLSEGKNRKGPAGKGKPKIKKGIKQGKAKR